MLRKHFLSKTFIIFLLFYWKAILANLQDDITRKIREKNNTITLSRKRRYLVFPEGSSFQVVFDLSYPTVGGPNLFVFGNTAALAWELPSKPVFLNEKYLNNNETTTTTTSTTAFPILHLDHSVPEVDHYDDLNFWQPPVIWNKKSEWQDRNSVINERLPISSYSNPFDSYVRKTTPVNQRRRIMTVSGVEDGRRPIYRTNPIQFWNRNSNYRRVQNFPSKINFQKTIHHQIHRRSRRELYMKIEKLFNALTKNGTACILKVICQVNKKPKEKGTLIDELLKTIFKVKPDEFYPDEDHYDYAANSNRNNNSDCDEIYPECDGNVLNKLFRM